MLNLNNSLSNTATEATEAEMKNGVECKSKNMYLHFSSNLPVKVAIF